MYAIRSYYDVQGLPAIDLLGQKEGWVISRRKQLTGVTGEIAVLATRQTPGAAPLGREGGSGVVHHRNNFV